MRFGSEFEREKAAFDGEVDPFDAIRVARDTVQRQRQRAARERDQKALVGR